MRENIITNGKLSIYSNYTKFSILKIILNARNNYRLLFASPILITVQNFGYVPKYLNYSIKLLYRIRNEIIVTLS